MFLIEDIKDVFDFQNIGLIESRLLVRPSIEFRLNWLLLGLLISSAHYPQFDKINILYLSYGKLIKFNNPSI